MIHIMCVIFYYINLKERRLFYEKSNNYRYYPLCIRHYVYDRSLLRRQRYVRNLRCHFLTSWFNIYRKRKRQIIESKSNLRVAFFILPKQKGEVLIPRLIFYAFLNLCIYCGTNVIAKSTIPKPSVIVPGIIIRRPPAMQRIL